MTSLNLTYADIVGNALETNLDEDARGVFSYVSDEEEAVESEDDNNPDDDDHGGRTYCVGRTLSNLRSPIFWIMDTGASTHSTPHKMKAC